MGICDLINNVSVFGLEESIRGAKFPMATNIEELTYELTDGIKKLAISPKGEGHDNWLNGVIVQFDLKFTVKCWTEAERYHFFDFISSQSTMHRITKFNLDNAYIEYVDKRIVDIMKDKVDEYNKLQNYLKDEGCKIANDETEKIKKDLKRMYLEILYSNPCGFKLTARMTTNYRQLKTIYSQRKNHRLPEWRAFANWIESLPYAKELITYEVGDSDE